MLEQLDQQLFLYLNSIHSPFWDRVMHTVSGIAIWIPLYLAILVYLGLRYRKKFIVILFFIILAATLADQVSVQLFKNIFHRLRPCHEPAIRDMVHLVDGRCGGMYGFISSHATNCFNVALLSMLFIRKRWFSISILCWAVIIGYSRIYLGVHYPGDVICGALVGALIGWGIFELYSLADRRVLQHSEYFTEGTSER
jgi:undecaprenyl-diphosphatase